MSKAGSDTGFSINSTQWTIPLALDRPTLRTPSSYPVMQLGQLSRADDEQDAESKLDPVCSRVVLARRGEDSTFANPLLHHNRYHCYQVMCVTFAVRQHFLASSS